MPTKYLTFHLTGPAQKPRRPLNLNVKLLTYRNPLMIQRANLVSFLCLLAGCASQQSSSQPQTFACAVTVIQDGTTLQSTQNGRVRYYELKGAPFRFEVPSTQCNPSVGVFLSLSDFQYVADSRLVATTSGFSLAGGNENRDVLFMRSENPRLVNGYEGIFDSVKNEYEALCTEFGKCPLKVRAYRSYWNFLGEEGDTITTRADFKRLTMEKPLQGHRGDIPILVYTKVKDVSGGYLSAMETHPIVLRFK